jgi:hypothetical protein
MRYGLNPEDDFCIDHWKNFRDADHKSWEQIIERFNQMIEDILAGREPRIFPPPELKFKEIPREPVIRVAAKESHLPVDEQAKSFEEFAVRVYEETKVKVTPEEARRILEEEYAKGDKCHLWFKPLLENKEYLWNILRPKDLEEEVKWTTLTRIGPQIKSLRDIIEAAKSVFNLNVTEDDVKRWIKEELEKPPEKAHTMVRMHRGICEELLK